MLTELCLYHGVQHSVRVSVSVLQVEVVSG